MEEARGARIAGPWAGCVAVDPPARDVGPAHYSGGAGLAAGAAARIGRGRYDARSHCGPIAAERRHARPGQSIREASLEYHRRAPAGKIALSPTKQLTNQRDLALAYSPGVAAACDEIVRDPREASSAHRARQSGRRRHQRHGGARPRRHRTARGEAGDGRQGGAVQEVRRPRLLRHRDRRARPGQAGRHDRARSSRRSAASTSRTSRRPSASTSSASAASG